MLYQVHGQALVGQRDGLGEHARWERGGEAGVGRGQAAAARRGIVACAGQPAAAALVQPHDVIRHVRRRTDDGHPQGLAPGVS